MELTLELSQRKWPEPATLGALFAANLDALLALPLTAMFGGARCGVHGVGGGDGGNGTHT